MRVFRNKSYLKNLALSLETELDFLLVRLCDLSITECPTYARKAELSYYIIDELKRNNIYNYANLINGIPHVLNSTYIRWVSTQVTDEEFIESINIISRYLDILEHLENVYEYDNELYVKPNSRKPIPYTLRKLKSTDEKGRFNYSIKDIKTPFNSVSYPITVSYDFHEHYYKYFVRVTSSYLPTGWTFFRGLTREQEKPFIRMCLEGWLSPTNTDLIGAWGIYIDKLKKDGVTVYKDLMPVIEEDYEILMKKHSDLSIHHINEYELAFSSLIEPNYPLYLTPLLHSEELLLEKELQANGYGGEFKLTPKGYKDVPFPVKLDTGETLKMYKVRGNGSLTYNNFYLEDFYSRIRAYGVDVDDDKLFEVTKCNKSIVERGLISLERGGYKVAKNKNIV